MVEKIQIGPYITTDLNKKFRAFLVLKYKTFEKGLLSHEVESAMRYWMDMHTKAQKHLLDKTPNPTPKVVEAYLTIKQFLLSRYYAEIISGQHILRDHLIKAIQNTRGSDKRTVAKWLRVFVENGLVKLLSATMVEVM